MGDELYSVENAYLKLIGSYAACLHRHGSHGCGNPAARADSYSFFFLGVERYNQYNKSTKKKAQTT